jgi:hypothetical protein
MRCSKLWLLLGLALASCGRTAPRQPLMFGFERATPGYVIGYQLGPNVVWQVGAR